MAFTNNRADVKVCAMLDKSPAVDPLMQELFEFKAKKGDLKKIEIIEACIECLATIGHEKCTYEAIAQKIGTRRAHVAYHFSNKNDIFEGCVRFILASYQQTSLEHLKKASTGEQMIDKLIEAPFIWAQERPQQVKVMLLFYYLAGLKENYLELHNQIRSGGVKRIEHILTQKMDKTVPVKEAKLLAKTIQNLISGAIMDAVTTNLTSLKKAKANTIAESRKLIQLALSTPGEDS